MSKIKINIIHSNDDWVRKDPIIEVLICKDQGIDYIETTDARSAFILSKGRISPTNGFIMVTNEDEILFDYFDLINWINKKGLRLC